MRAWAKLIPGLLVLLVAGQAWAQPIWVQLDDPPAEDAEPQVEDPVDLVDLYIASNATHLAFREDLVGMPDVGNHTYVIDIDNPRAGPIKPDYRLVHALSGSYLEKWDGTQWIYLEAVVVTVDGANNSLIFEVPLDSVGGLNKDMEVWFENFAGADSFTELEDRAPNTGAYRIKKESIPNLPLLVLPSFVGGLIGTLLLVRRRFFPS